MKRYPNECECGGPIKIGGLCARCLNLEIHCITAHGDKELKKLVRRKQRKGFKVRGGPLPIGGGHLVQPMVFRP